MNEGVVVLNLKNPLKRSWKILPWASVCLIPALVWAQTTDAAAVASTNPYGLQAMWEGGDLVSKGTLFILLAMSLGSWSILITKLRESFQLAAQARAARAQFFQAGDLQQGLKRLPEGTAFHFIAQQAITAGEHHEGTLTQHIDRNTWVTMSIERSVGEVQSRLQNGLAFLARSGASTTH
jgi:biopolymer transport protein ExbB